MSNPDDFMLNTDYATLRNSQTGLTAQLTLPSAQVVSGGGYYETHVDIPINESYAIATARIASSKNSNRFMVANASDFYRTGVVTGIPGFLYEVYVFIWRVNATTVRFQALIQNPYSDPLTGATGAETFTVFVNTFVPPFA